MVTMTKLECQSHGGIATKMFHSLPDGQVVKHPVKVGKKFSHEAVNVTTIPELYEFLKSLSSNSKAFLVRGKVKIGSEDVIIRRSNGELATFEENPTNWMMIDIDKLAYPEQMDVASNPEEVIQWIKSQLPDPFKLPPCVFRFSSSQGIAGSDSRKTVSVHLHYLLDRKISSKEAKAYLMQEGCAIADLSLYNPVHPHFTADPILVDVEDQLVRRIGIC